ncbi:MAG: thiamine pyrophosphate-binding protein, partial [Deltaproteobacteria bacterium]|nr:thiamine pyrophosphate-binding protein [Deltaproteobacteria bacterium]
FWERPDIIDPERQKIIQIDIDSRNAGWVFPVEISLIGDVKAIIQQIIDKGKDVNADFRDRVTSLEQRKTELDFFQHPALYSNEIPILPERLVKCLQDNLDPSAIITLDAGNNRIWMSHFFKCRRPATIFGPSGIGGMGWAPPASLAAKLVHPDRTCVSVSSDGGFMMSLHVLSSSLQYNLPVIFVVMNNSALGMVMHSQREKTIASILPETNYAKIAQAFGCEGLRVDKPQDLAPALRKAISSKRSTVLDVIIDADESLSEILSCEPKH